MMAEQRYRAILQMMQKDGSIKATTLSDVLAVSSETVRRDLKNMELQGLLRRTHGGAVLRDYGSRHLPVDYTPFLQREEENLERKKQIGLLATAFIKEGEAVALDSGTTALELAREIKIRFSRLTVITNSLAISNELSDAPGITLIVTGGVYNRDEAAFTSDIATSIFSSLHINTFFLTAFGISADCGLTYPRMDEIPVQKKIMEASEKTICISDSSKLGVNSLMKMCDINKISMLITDSHAAKHQIEPFERAGIKVIKP